MKSVIATSIIVLSWMNFMDAVGQTLWIQSEGKTKKDCNSLVILQTPDTLYFFNSGKEEWSGSFRGTSIPYHISQDSIFKETISAAELYALTSDPSTLPDSLKGEIFIGTVHSDSLLILRKPGYRDVFKKISGIKQDEAFEKNLSDLLATHALKINVSKLTNRSDDQIEIIAYPKKDSPSYHGDPFPRTRGIYKIGDTYFLFLPKGGEKVFQIIQVDNDGLILETLCGERKRVKVTKEEKH